MTIFQVGENHQPESMIDVCWLGRYLLDGFPRARMMLLSALRCPAPKDVYNVV